MSILDHVEATAEQREEIIRWCNSRRRGAAAEGEVEEAFEPKLYTAEQLAALAEREQLVLTITRNGFGKRTSAYEYRVTNRGGQGIINIETSARNGKVAAAFPVADTDQLMLVTDKGQTIRIAVGEIRIAGRNTQGVKLFTTDADERIVSAARLSDTENGGEDGEENGIAEG